MHFLDPLTVLLLHTDPLPLSHISPHVVEVGRRSYPHVSENACSGGTVFSGGVAPPIEGDFCICSTTVVETTAHSSLPSRENVLLLNIGAFDIDMYDAGNYTFVEETSGVDASLKVAVYKPSDKADYSIETVFRVVRDGQYVWFKNVHSVVEVCDGTYKFRNSPTFFDLAHPQLTSAYREIEAYIDYVDNHPSAPPFACTSLMKHFGYSNPSPNHVLSCSQAYKSGTFTYVNPSDTDDTLSFGVTGERGNLAAVAASIVLHDDALSSSLDLDPAAGTLKSPLLKLSQNIRSFQLTRTLHHRYVPNSSLCGLANAEMILTKHVNCMLLNC